MDIEKVNKLLLAVENLVNNPPDYKIKETSKTKVQMTLKDLQQEITEDEYALKQARKIGTLFNILYGPPSGHMKYGGADGVKNTLHQHFIILNRTIMGNLKQ